MGRRSARLIEVIPRPLKYLVLKVPGVRPLVHKVRGFPVRRPVLPVTFASARGPVPEIDRLCLRSDYANKPIAQEPDTFVLYRIIGNDLYPRHQRGQSRQNLKFILENEPPLDGCEKRFVVNRIVDPDEENRIISMLEQAGFEYLHIPFRREEYFSIGWDADGIPREFAPHSEEFPLLDEVQQGRVLMRLYRHKNNYVMNNNGARNAALRSGRGIAKFVLPWDGNCFLTRAAWREIRRSVLDYPEVPYHVVPMARVTNNARLLDPSFRPLASDEPQIVFRSDTTLEFDEDFYYGRRPKVELLWRLGVPGAWTEWPIEPWELPCPPYAEEAGAFRTSGWVARLSSGRSNLERTTVQGLIERGTARIEAVIGMLDRLDSQAPRNVPAAKETVFVLGSTATEACHKCDDLLARQLRAAADGALSRAPYSVTDKTTLPPSKNPNDYWHPAPYYWPNPLRIPGLPYVRRDGLRVPGTLMYEPLSERYDRTRLQRLFDDTYILALAFRELGESRYAEHAAKLVWRWFLEPRTRMNPHLEYAQVRRGHNGNRGNSSGIIEMKDVYYFLDGVRVLYAADLFSGSERDSLRRWFSDYMQWLQTSAQGREERAATGNHGTYFDLQLASIALFLGDRKSLLETLRDSRMRIVQQFTAEGRQPEEMSRTKTAHYCCFNLQGWVRLAELAARCGEDLWYFQGTDGRGLERAMSWLLMHMNRPWPYPQIDGFDAERFYPLYYAYLENYDPAPCLDGSIVPPPARIKPLFHPHDGITPFWQIR